MDAKEALAPLRQEITRVTGEMVRLFEERMRLSEKIAEVKAAGNLPITDEKREREVLEAAAGMASGEHRAETLTFARSLIALSKVRQSKKLLRRGPVAMPEPSPMKTAGLTVAFQGVPGAWSESGALLLFPDASLSQRDYFEDVFEAVKSGEADYGVLPIENAQTGAIGEAYDLLRRHSCFIVGQTWVTVAQCLLAPKGAAISDIREVFSHPEGFSQCRRFLKNRSWDLTACRNTAVAAQMVAQRGDNRCAAIGSRRAAAVYGLQVLAPDVMDNPQNRTRFIAIAAKPAYGETADAVSVTFSTAHKSGALSAVLECFALAGINMTRIESRPASLGTYRFFIDLQANLASGEVRGALEQAAAHCEYFEILGCYPSEPGAHE